MKLQIEIDTDELEIFKDGEQLTPEWIESYFKQNDAEHLKQIAKDGAMQALAEEIG